MYLGRHHMFPKIFWTLQEPSFGDQMYKWYTQWRIISKYIKVGGRTNGRRIYRRLEFLLEKWGLGRGELAGNQTCLKEKMLPIYIYIYIYIYIFCRVGWGCRIHQLLLCRGVRPSLSKCPTYDTKQSDGEAPVMLDLWRLQSTPSLPLLPSPLWPVVVAPDKVLSMGQIELNCVLMTNWIVWNRTVFVF